MADMIRLFDRSRTVTDWQCPRRRWWQYEYGGKGVVNGTTSLELYLGTTVHDALAALAQGEHDIDTIALVARQQMFDALVKESTGDEFEAVYFANEQGALVEGLVRGFHRQVWPQLRAAYPTLIAAEREVTYQVTDHLTFMAKPDLILADAEGNWVYIEYKTTASKKESWMNSWNTAVQLHSSVKAVEQTLGTAPSVVIVQGLYKGYESYGKQNSPFCYSYQRKGSPPFSKDETRYDYAAGFKRYPTWEMVGGVKSWVAGMPENVLVDQFPATPPIFVKEDLVARFFSQREWREKEIELATQLIADSDPEGQRNILDVAFPQHFEECTPAWGRGCGYRQLCHGQVEDPLQAGFTWRESHHDLEREQHAQS